MFAELPINKWNNTIISKLTRRHTLFTASYDDATTPYRPTHPPTAPPPSSSLPHLLLRNVQRHGINLGNHKRCQNENVRFRFPFNFLLPAFVVVAWLGLATRHSFSLLHIYSWGSSQSQNALPDAADCLACGYSCLASERAAAASWW